MTSIPNSKRFGTIGLGVLLGASGCSTSPDHPTTGDDFTVAQVHRPLVIAEDINANECMRPPTGVFGHGEPKVDPSVGICGRANVMVEATVVENVPVISIEAAVARGPASPTPAPEASGMSF